MALLQVFMAGKMAQISKYILSYSGILSTYSMKSFIKQVVGLSAEHLKVLSGTRLCIYVWM
jgi:hypothetical protein